MNDFLSNWPVIVGIAAVIAAVVIGIAKFAGLPTAAQIAKIKEVLLVWVIQAEKELGGGTGQVKLRYVYDLFVARFPSIAKLIKFETFSGWVDEALQQMRELLKSNENLEAYVGNEK